jgi:serine protease AprX
MRTTRLLAIGVAASCVTVCAGVAPAGADAATQTGGPPVRVIVRASGGNTALAGRSVLGAGGRVVGVQSGLGTVVADVSDPVALEGLPGVALVSRDAAVQAQSLGAEAAGQAGSMTSVLDAINARSVWQKGITGKGIDVAVIDTGVVPVAPLLSDNHLVVGPDLSMDSQVDALRQLDGYGHGTHMAGIIAGREGPAASGATYAADTSNFYGVAPDARIVSLKVGDHAGAVDVSQVIAAIDWVVQNWNKNGLNIRVLNLSYGTTAAQDPLADPLSYAAEIAVRAGIVVVTAAGNNGATTRGLINPAFNTNVIAVGAADSKGTATVADDTIAPFSAVAGGLLAPTRRPDVVAPGKSIVSLAVPGGTIAMQNPGAMVGTSGIKGSGTSQAAAVVSGAVALILQDRPWLVSMHVKDILARTARPLALTSKDVQGAGEVDVAAALAAYGGWSNEVVGNGKGSLEVARGGVHLIDSGIPLAGEKDVLGGAWDPAKIAQLTLASGAWTKDMTTFNGTAWIGPGWVDGTAKFATWTGHKWAGQSWIGHKWAGNVWSGESWDGKTTSTKTWTATGWTGTGWESEVTLSTLASRVWATSQWK